MAASFEKLERLGSGNFGEVWLARDTGLDILRAVKFIPKGRVTNPKNFFQEAQILKAAEHPNVVRVEETGEMDDDSIYVAMEYLSGRSLDDEAKGSYIPLSRVKWVMSDVLRGLEHAHFKGILHRDIKPANILVGATREGKLSDFGLALPAGVNPAKLGMKDYKYVVHMAPEVAAGAPYHVNADIYACGVTMYRLVNGDSFFSVPTGGDLLDLIQAGKFPDRSHYRDFIPRPWRVVINRAMSVEPGSRYPSAADMRHAVESLKARVNWQERRLSNGFLWTAAHDGRCVAVTLVQRSRKLWEVEVRKGRSKNMLRRVGSLCGPPSAPADAASRARRILQDFVLGRLV
jgi:eukaryotic-like serine/threonine-protein kinase